MCMPWWKPSACVCRRKNWHEKYHLAQEAVAAGGVGIVGEKKIGRNPGASQSKKTMALREKDWVNKILADPKEFEDEILYPLVTQQIKIDLDDGVKVNCGKFGKALAKIPGL